MAMENDGLYRKETLFLAFWSAFLALFFQGCAAISVPEPSGNLLFWLDQKVPEDKAPEPVEEDPRPLKKGFSREEVIERRKRAEALFRIESEKDVPGDFIVLWQARRLLSRGDLDKAALKLVDWLSKNPDDFLGLVELGKVRIGQGDFKEAEKVLKRALELAPWDKEALFQLSKALALRGDEKGRKEAFAVLQRLGKDHLYQDEKAIVYAGLLLKLGKYGEAEKFLEKACERNPGADMLVYYKAQAQRFLGKIDGASASLEPLLRGRPEPLPEALWLHGILMKRKGNFAKALEDLRKLEKGKGIRYKFFFTKVMPRDFVSMVVKGLEKEVKAGRRLFYLPGESLEILKTDRSVENRLLVVRSLQKDPPRDYLNIIRQALKDPSEKVRIEAVRAIGTVFSRDERCWSLLLGGMDSESPRVRGNAAIYIGMSGRKDTAPILLEHLEKERDPYAFRCIHEALERVTGRKVLLLSGDEDDPASRARTVRQWKEILKK